MLQYSSVKPSSQQQHWEAQMRNVVSQGSNRCKIFLDFCLLLRSWSPFWNISARSSAKAKASGAKHSPPSFFLRWPKGLKFKLWRNPEFLNFISISDEEFLEDPQAIHFSLKVMTVSFNVQVSNLHVNSKTDRTNWDMLFYKGRSDTRFSGFSGFSCGFGHHFKAFRRAAAQKPCGAKHSPLQSILYSAPLGPS